MIIDLQRRIAEVGRIRIGQQVPTGTKGKTRPTKLETFRLTSSDQLRISQAAGLYGGTPKPWNAPAGKQWEVITTATALDVIVPPSDMAFSQSYELWTTSGCQRRCDGVSESISQGGCLCDPGARECDIHTRLSVMLRDLPGLGVWRIDTSGYYAATELQGAVHVIQLAAARGEMLPARLRLDPREVKRPNPETGKSQTRKFAVPVLDIEISPGQLMAGGQPAAELGEGRPEKWLSPVPELDAGPTPSVAEQATAVNTPEPKKPRANAATPIPATGLAPRTATEVAGDLHPGTSAMFTAETDAPKFGEVTPISPGQITAVHTLFGQLGITDRDTRLQITSDTIGRHVDSTKDLTFDEAGRLLDVLAADTARDMLDHRGAIDQPSGPEGTTP